MNYSSRPTSALFPVDFSRTGSVLFFSPEAAVEPHLVAQCIVARTLQSQGYEPIFVRCFELFPRCPVMDMHGMNHSQALPVQSNVCAQCVGSSLKILTHFSLPFLNLPEFATPEVYATVDELLSAIPDQLSEFTYDQIPFGKLAAVDLVLSIRRSQLRDIDAHTRHVWLSYIKSSLISYLTVKNLLAHVPVSRLLYFNDYSLLFGARMAAEKAGVPSFYVSLASYRGVDRSKYLIIPTSLRQENVRLLERWQEWKPLSISANAANEVMVDLMSRLGKTGSHIFSPAKSQETAQLVERLGLSPAKKLIVAYTSSLDEFIAGRMHSEAFGHDMQLAQPFGLNEDEMQLRWLTALVNHVENSSDRILAVRVHPREARLGVGGIKPDYLAILREKFDRPLRNCHFIWPEEDISSYDLGELADVALTCYSTIGLELARMGVPVIAAYRGFTITDNDFLGWAPTEQEYFDLLEKMLSRTTSLENIIPAFRFSHYYTLSSAIDMSDLIPSPTYDGIPPFHIPHAVDAIRDIVIEGKDIVRARHLELKGHQSPAFAADERSAIASELRRLVHFVFTGEVLSGDPLLIYIRAAKSIAIDLEENAHLLREQGMYFIFCSDTALHYVAQGRTYSRYSPMISRLAPLCAQNSLTLTPTG